MTAQSATRSDGQLRGDVLVGPQWLAEHLDDPRVRVVEVDVGSANFDEWHIDGAVLWNIYRDLKDGDYRLVGREALEDLFERSGIGPDSTVVFYGYGPAMGLWLMKLFGHADARILDCDRSTWRAEGRPWTTDVGTPPRARYPLPGEDGQVRVRGSEVERAIDRPSTTIFDVRSEPEFRGERFWPSGGQEPGGRAGHIPTAVNLSIEGLHDEGGSFRDAAELAQVFSSVDLAGDGELITYCTIGGRASTAWFALTYLLDRKNVRVYDGSWAEWGRQPATPVAMGADLQESPAQRERKSTMANLVRMSLDAPEETRPFEDDKGHLELVNLDGGAVGRATFQPGWMWSKHVKPIAKTDSCQAAHTGYFVSGRMTVVMDDGEQMDYGPGDFAVMAPGHDAWVVGDEPCVVIDWQGFADYARP